MSQGERPDRVVAIVGPTAAGKSALAMALAQQQDGEIVNADSMQLYRGMDIGTAKPSAADRACVPHHLLDVLSVSEPGSVAVFQQQARAAIADILGRGRLAILVGGSGLYVRAVLDDFEFPGTDPAVRARLETELAELGPAGLHARLARADPGAAAAILPTNGRRVVRALEVIELTGRPFTATLPGQRPFLPSVRIGLLVPRDVLVRRISDRVDRMWTQGLVDEVQGLLLQGLANGRTAGRALGYQQAMDQLAGRCDEAEAKAATVKATVAFARRQLTWFRRDPDVRWLAYDEADLIERTGELARAPRLDL